MNYAWMERHSGQKHLYVINIKYIIPNKPETKRWYATPLFKFRHKSDLNTNSSEIKHYWKHLWLCKDTTQQCIKTKTVVFRPFNMETLHIVSLSNHLKYLAIRLIDFWISQSSSSWKWTMKGDRLLCSFHSSCLDGRVIIPQKSRQSKAFCAKKGQKTVAFDMKM